jgi:hypothetical protein
MSDVATAAPRHKNLRPERLCAVHQDDLTRRFPLRRRDRGGKAGCSASDDHDVRCLYWAHATTLRMSELAVTAHTDRWPTAYPFMLMSETATHTPEQRTKQFFDFRLFIEIEPRA